MPFAQALGGAERLLRTLALRGPTAGLDLHVVFHENGPLELELAAAGIPTSVIALGRFRDARAGATAVRATAGLIRAERPDIVLSWLPRSHLYLAPAAVLAGRRHALVWWQHGTGDGEGGLMRAATALPASAVVCTSAAAAGHQAALRPRRRLAVCHPGVDVSAATPAARLDALRASLQLPNDRPVVGLLGRLVPWKGHLPFLDAIARLRAEGQDVHGLIVGGNAYDLAPGYEDQLHRRAAAADLAGAVTFTGHVADPADHVQLMDVLVNASGADEAFGMTLIEAMAAGVPVLAVAAGGPSEIVVHGDSGVLVPDASPRALCEGLAGLLADPGYRTRLAQGGVRRHAEAFTAEAFTARAAATLRTVRAGA